jgi:hypothetical protein
VSTTVETAFNKAWDEEIEKRKQQSPSFDVSDYTATGRASAKYGGKRNELWWRENGPQMVQDYIDWREAHPNWSIPEIGGKPAIELELRFTLPGMDMQVLAFVDRVFATPTGEFGVFDLKTGRTPETPEQLGLYRVGLGLCFDIWPEWGWFWSPGGKGHGQPLDLTMYTPEYFSALFQQAIAGINAGAFLPQPANNCKAWCGVSRFCMSVNGPEAKGHDPLAG